MQLGPARACLLLGAAWLLFCLPGLLDGPRDLCPPPAAPPARPHLYLVTPTYSRPEQEAELTRLAQTLMHVEQMTWLVVEDSESVSPRVRRVLARFQGKVSYHLMAGGAPGHHRPLPAAMPDKEKKSKKKFDPRTASARGVANR
jgi:hypothetical protein